MCLEFGRDYLMVTASFILFLALLLLLLLLENRTALRAVLKISN